MRNRRRRKGFPIERDRGNRVGAPLCAFLALLALISIARAGVIEQKYPDDKAVKSRYTVVADGKKSGPYWRYFENGKLQESGNYRADQLDGAREVFHANGKIKTREAYRAGELHA